MCHSNDVVTVVWPWFCTQFHASKQGWPVFDVFDVTRTASNTFITNLTGTISTRTNSNVGIFDLLTAISQSLQQVSFEEMWLLLPPEYREVYSNLYIATPKNTNNTANTTFIPIEVTNDCWTCFVNEGTNMLVNTNWFQSQMRVIDVATGTNITGSRFSVFTEAFKDAMRPKLSLSRSGAMRVSAPEFSRLKVEASPYPESGWTNFVPVLDIGVEGTNSFNAGVGPNRLYYRARTTP